MRTIDSQALGVEEITGADVLGGAFWPQVGIGIVIAISAAVLRDWDDFRNGIVSGYTSGASGNW